MKGFFGLQYNIRKLSKQANDLERFQMKLYSTPIQPFTPEEGYELRKIHMNMLIEINALEQAIAIVLDEYTKPFWKKILNK